MKNIKLKRLRGSLTIEAALAMPLFILAISQLIFWTSFLQTQSRLNAEAASKAREMAQMAYISETGNENDEEIIEIYKGEFLNGVYFERLALARPFTGRKYKNTGNENSEDNRIVFVTKNGKVYHTSNICSHIRLSVKAVDYSIVGGMRNKGGAKYYPCEYCARGGLSGTVYITEDGNRIHKNKNCSGIKRTVISIKKSDAEARGYRPCERCGRVHD